MRTVSTALVVLFASVSATAIAQKSATPAAPTAPASPSAAAADRPEKTPAGSTFTAPAGWTTSIAPKSVELAAPEKDFYLAFLDVGEAKDAAAAVAVAWQAWRPTQTRPPKLVTARAPRDGWDEKAVIDYEVSPKREAQPLCHRLPQRRHLDRGAG